MCQKALKLMLRNDDKVDCYLKTHWIDMSLTDQTKCWSIVKDYLNYWAHIYFIKMIFKYTKYTSMDHHLPFFYHHIDHCSMLSICPTLYDPSG